MAYDEYLAGRIRACLSDAVAVREQPMMGALVFMVEGHMTCGVSGDALMVRVGKAAYEAAMKQDHVRPMAMSGRSPRGFVLVDPPGLETDQALHTWIARAREFVASLKARPGER